MQEFIAVLWGQFGFICMQSFSFPIEKCVNMGTTIGCILHTARVGGFNSLTYIAQVNDIKEAFKGLTSDEQAMAYSAITAVVELTPQVSLTIKRDMLQVIKGELTPSCVAIRLLTCADFHG